jgi:hypothetical protein
MPGLHPGAPKPTGVSEGSIITFSFKTAIVLIPSVLAHVGLFFWINKLSVEIAESSEELSDG